MLLAIFTGPVRAEGTPSPDKRVFDGDFTAAASRVIDGLDGIFGVVLHDLKSGERFTHLPDRPFTQASVIKLPVLVDLFRQDRAGNLELDELITVPEADFVGGSGILRWLTPGKTTMTLLDLAILMIVLSDNTATNLVINRVGMENVNRTMEELGYAETRLRRLMMDVQASREGRENISTPAETADLLAKIHRHEILDAEACAEIIRILAMPKTGRINARLPAGVRVANKTGSLARGGVVNDAGVIEAGDAAVIVSAMINEGTDRSASEAAIAEISRLAFEAVTRQ